MIDNIINHWLFHFTVRLIALVIISVSVFSITTQDGGNQVRAEQVNTPQVIRLENMKAQKQDSYSAQDFFVIEPKSGVDAPSVIDETWKIEEDRIEVDGVLVPQKEVVISSSRDGKIVEILFENGDRFKKGDTLIRYDCKDVEAEADIAGVQKALTETKARGGEQLFKLDIISNLDRLGIETEDKQAAAKIKLYESRLEDCIIKAGFDGHVTKRLANEGEYTRTDRVLMEIVSSDPLSVEFLLPSKWLRWINKGSPLTVIINETEKPYEATITRIYGEVDPISQSIQIRGALKAYKDPLLPGMSGKVTINASESRNSGVNGYLSRPKQEG